MPYLRPEDFRVQRLAGDFTFQSFPVPRSSLGPASLGGQFVSVPYVLPTSSLGQAYTYYDPSTGVSYPVGAGGSRGRPGLLQTELLGGMLKNERFIAAPLTVGLPRAALGGRFVSSDWFEPYVGQDFASDFAGFVDRYKLPILAVGVGLLFLGAKKRRRR